jgi:fructose/tagatose bisphosphate aldolase
VSLARAGELLDHVNDLDLLHRAADAGFGSVMYDASRLPHGPDQARRGRRLRHGHWRGRARRRRRQLPRHDHQKRASWLTKINIGTQLNVAFTHAVREALTDAAVTDPRRYLRPAADSVTQTVAAILSTLGA